MTPKDFHFKRPPTSLPVPVLLEGTWLDQNLAYLHKDRQWVLQRLQGQWIPSEQIEELMLVQVEPDETLTFDWNNSTSKVSYPPDKL